MATKEETELMGTFKVKPFTMFRQGVTDLMEESFRKHHIPDLMSADITLARQYLREHKRLTGESISHTGWIIKCISQAVSENKEVQAYRHGRRKMVVFDDVDVWLAFDRNFDGEKQVWPSIIRKANEKSVKEIHDEIRKVQEQFAQPEPSASERQQVSRMNKFKYVPRFITRLWWTKLRYDAFLAKKIAGTVAVTSASMGMKCTQVSIPRGLHPLIICVGSIARKPGVVGDRIEIREILDFSVLSDHDVIDGVPVNMFDSRLVELLENAFGLDKFPRDKNK
jgi:pyruvate/2-oxoglutarate dehydrogenase complex dihydrolipoamide acyltransferase (E2) component